MRHSLLISEVFPPMSGGSGRWFWEVYRRLPRTSVTIAAGQQAGDEEFDRQHDAPVERLPLTLRDWGIRSRVGRAGYWRAWRAAKRLVKEHRIAEVHCGKALPEGWIAWLLKARFGIPYVCYVHGEELMVAEGSRELRWLTRRVLSGAKLVIANSRNTNDLLVDRWNVRPNNLRVMHPGADTRNFRPAQRDERVRDSLGWSGRSVVLTAGRLQRRKGQDMLIRALPAIRQRVPNVLYSIVGDGADRDYLRQLVDELNVADGVQFRGEPNDEELARCYQQCDLFVLPNRAVGKDIEGFGMVLVEAQACCKAVIAGDSGGTRETMIVGETGLVVDCTRAEPLADAVVELLLDPARCQAMGAVGREWAVEQFDWEALAREAQTIFEMQPTPYQPPRTLRRGPRTSSAVS